MPNTVSFPRLGLASQKSVASENGLTVEHDGRKYRREEKKFSLAEKIGRIFLGCLATISTFGLALISKDIRSLFKNASSDMPLPLSKKNALDIEKKTGKMIFNSYILPGETSIFLTEESNFKLRTFPTQGDGSCGLHALLGTYSNQGVFTLNNVKEKRLEFADQLKMQFDKGEIPKYIKKAMKRYALYDTPRAIQEMFSSEKEILSQISEIQTLRLIVSKSPQEREENAKLAKEKIHSLICNPIYQSAYLSHVRDSSSYLSTEELGAFAIASNKNLRIYQGDKNIGASHFSFFDAGSDSETVEIYLDQTQHFERACRSSFEETLPELSLESLKMAKLVSTLKGVSPDFEIH